MAKRTGNIDLPTFAFLCIMAFALWGATAYLLFAVVKPEMSLDNGRTFVFDSIALAEATSIMTGVVILSWLPILTFVQKKASLLTAGLAAASAWAFLSVPFALIDKFDVINVERFRASRVMEDGSDLAFLPLLIPLIAIFSGVAYSLAMWLSLQSKQFLQRRRGMA